MYKKIIGLISLLFFCSTNNLFADVPIDNFESYMSDSELQNIWEWTDIFTGDQVTTTLSATGGAGSTKALQLEFTFSEGQVNPWGYTGGLVNNDNPEHWSGNDSIRVWLKATFTGDSLQYIQLAIHEGNNNVANSSWGDKMRSAKVYINDLDSTGEYVSLAFSDFEDYGGFGGPRDNGTLELDDIRSILIFSRYDGTASGGSASILVDDISVFGGTSIVRYPYLQNVTQTGVKVLWGSWNFVGKLFYGTSPGVYTDSIASSAFPDNDGVYVHTVEINGLTVGDTIYYYVRDGESENIGFNDPTYYAVTAPEDDASFRLVVYSDSQGSPWWETQHGAVINAMIPHDPDIILNCGDISQNGQLYQFNDYFFANAAPIQKNTPIYTAIGNHDMLLEPTGNNYDIDIKNYHDLMDLPMNNSLEDGTEDYYSFDYGLVHFVCLNTQRVRNWGEIQPYYNATYNDSMKAWLERDLQATTKPWKVVYFHIQAWNNSVYNKGWSPIFENYGVNLVFYGHGHAYYANYRNDVIYVMTGGGGGKLHPIPWYAWPENRIGAFYGYHFTQVDVTPDELFLNIYDKDNNLRHWIKVDADGTVNYPALVSIDDFETYATTEELQGVWNLTDALPGSDSLTVTLAAGSENGTGNVMQLDFSYPFGSEGFWSAVGLSGQWNWSTHNGINLWIKADVTGDSGQSYQIRIGEAEGGDKWVATKPLSELDPNGQHVTIYFNDFVWYGSDSSSADGLMDLDNISAFYVGVEAASGPAAQNSTCTLLVDDISAFLVSVTSTHLDDDFERYADNAALAAKWDMVWTSKSTVNMSRNLEVSGGFNESRAMKMEIAVNSGTTPTTGLGVEWEPCIFGITGYNTASENQTDMTGYRGVKLWLKPGDVTGNGDFYFKLNLIEDEPSGTEEKWMSPKVYLKDLNQDGQYVYLNFEDFYQYNTNSLSAMELDKIKLSYLFLARDNKVTENSTATVFVDDIIYVKNLTIDSGGNILPGRFNLYQNYPNPFNPTTTIRYDLANTSDVQLVIYDILGREVMTLVNNRLEAGYHQVRWNGENRLGEKVASGVYIYTLQSGNNSMSRKLLLIK